MTKIIKNKKQTNKKISKNSKENSANSSITKLDDKKQDDIKITKNKKVLYTVFCYIFVFLILVLIVNLNLGLSLTFLIVASFIFTYRIINKKIRILSFNIGNKTISILIIFLLILSLIFLSKTIFFSTLKSDYYNKNIQKNLVTIDIKFNKNLFFNKYNVEISIYNDNYTLYHGINKTVKYQLPNGKHKVVFTGNGMQEIVNLDVKGKTYVKYQITSRRDEIEVKEIELKYPEEEEKNKKELYRKKLSNFIIGYEKYSSSIDVNSKIYFEGILKKIDVVYDDKGNQFLVGIIDENNVKWKIILNSILYVAKNHYEKYLNKKIYVRGLLKEKNEVTNIINMEKLLLTNSDEEETGIQHIYDSLKTNEQIIFLSSTDFKEKNYKEVENKLKEYGFKNIKIETQETKYLGNKFETVAEIKIAGKDFKKGDKVNISDELKIIYWIPKIEKVDYSTNDKETAKYGNQGIYSYKKYGNREYDIYYIIDFNEGYVYYFIDGSIGSNSCKKMKIKSGNLNDTLIYVINDRGKEYKEALYFKWKKQPDHLINEDFYHFKDSFYTTNLDQALKIKSKKICNK